MTTIKLNEKQRAEAKAILEDYQAICDVLHDVDRRIFQIFLTSDKAEEGDKDFVQVQVSRTGAKTLLQAEKALAEGELRKLGIEV